MQTLTIKTKMILTSNGETFKICRLTDEYIEEYADIVMSKRYNLYQQVKYDSRQSRNSLVKAIKQYKNGRYIVIDANKRLAGGIAIVGMHDKCVELSYFTSDLHKCKGIAKEVLNYVTHIIAENGMVALLHIDENNISSIKTAFECGYREFNRDKHIIEYRWCSSEENR